MKTLQFRITLLLLLCLGFSTANAQKLEKKHTEKFTVNKDVVIDVNTRYTDIEIETWNKNEVVVEAYIDVSEETDQKVIDDYLKKWNFEALGNKSSVKISSKSLGLIDIHSFDFDAPNYDALITENVNDALENLPFAILEMPEVLELPEVFEIPEMPEIPELPELPEMPSMPTKFDFKAYKKDKNYLEKWKKENKDVIGNNAKIKVGKNSISINSSKEGSSYKWNITTEGQNQLAEELEKSLKKGETLYQKRREILEERKIIREKRLKEIEEARKLALVKRQEANEYRKNKNKEKNEKIIEYEKARSAGRKEAIELRKEEFEKRRIEVKEILAKREKVKIKRIIKIKAPKNAKFNMNVRYGSMSFPK